jgi:hypothetical protein
MKFRSECVRARVASSNIACCTGDPCGRPVPHTASADNEGDHKGRPYIIWVASHDAQIPSDWPKASE